MVIWGFVVQLVCGTHISNPVYYSACLNDEEKQVARQALETDPIALSHFDEEAVRALRKILARRPIPDLAVKRLEKETYGCHAPTGVVGAIDLNGWLEWHEEGSFSTPAIGGTDTEVIQLAFVHEVGHVLVRRYAQQVENVLRWRKGVGVTEYAATVKSEYFSETLVAVALLPRLESMDPKGFRTVRGLLLGWADGL